MAAGDKTYIASKEYVDQQIDYAVIDTQSGSLVQSTVADDLYAEVVIQGKTVVTPQDPTKDISPDNPATIQSVGDEPFNVVASGENGLSNNIIIANPARSLLDGTKDFTELLANKEKHTCNIGKSVLDGTESWSIELENDDTILFLLTSGWDKDGNGDGMDNTINTKLLCNKFAPTPTAALYNSSYTKEGISISTGKTLRIRILKSRLSENTVTAFRNWLSSNNITIYYKLSNSVISETDKVALKTYKSITSITTTDPLQPIMTVKFKSRLGNAVEVILAKINNLT